jgi:hypothetical protein
MAAGNLNRVTFVEHLRQSLCEPRDNKAPVVNTAGVFAQMAHRRDMVGRQVAAATRAVLR